MPETPSVLAVIVNWNGASVLGESVESLLASDYKSLTVWVIDNASTDDSMRSLPDNVFQILCPQNLGYAGAINYAVQAALEETHLNNPPEYFLILNNDLKILPSALSTLMARAGQLGPAVLGPRILKMDSAETLEAAWGSINWSHVLCRFYGKGKPAGKPWITDQPVELLLGSALLIHRSIFDRVGQFDEQYFMYHEEVDFLYRVGQMGISCYFCAEASVLHRGGHSTKSEPMKKIFWIRRNTILFLRKHQATVVQWATFWATLSGSLLFNLLLFRWRRTQAIVAGVVEGFRIEICEPGTFSKKSISELGEA